MSGKLERDAFESMVCERLQTYETQPPMHIWTKLESNLDGKEIEDQKNRAWLPWASAAAVVLLSVGLTVQTTHPEFFKWKGKDDSFAQNSEKESKNKSIEAGLSQQVQPKATPSQVRSLAVSNAIASSKQVDKNTQSVILASLPVEGNPINVISVSPQPPHSVLDKIQVPTELISQMNLKEKNLVGAKDESSVVEMSQQEFLQLLRKNGYLNQEIPINQVVAQQTGNSQDKKGGRDFKKFVLKQLGNAQLIQLNDQDPNRMQYQLSTPVIQVSGNVH
jgi:hypothetical protein